MTPTAAAAHGPDFQHSPWHSSFLCAEVSQQPGAPGSPQCQQGLEMAALGSWRLCREQSWGLPVHVELPDGKGCCEQAAPRAQKGGTGALGLCQFHSPGQQPPSTGGTEGTARGTKAAKVRDWEEPELGAGTAASLHPWRKLWAGSKC